VKSYVYEEENRKDVLQESFAAIFSSLSSYDIKKGQFKPWIAKVTVNQCIKYLRSKNKLNLFVPLNTDTHQEIQNHDDLLDQFSRQDMLTLLSRMPEGYRAVFVLSIIDEYSHKEIAEKLNISVGTSRSQLSRAMNWLKKNLTNDLIMMKNG
jgi:RNA polymerase sigma-70 factor (ECF subfamily)